MNTSRNLVIETDIAIENGAVIEAVEGRDFRKVINIEDYRRNKKQETIVEDVKLIAGIVVMGVIVTIGIFLL